MTHLPPPPWGGGRHLCITHRFGNAQRFRFGATVSGFVQRFRFGSRVWSNGLDLVQGFGATVSGLVQWFRFGSRVSRNASHFVQEFFGFKDLMQRFLFGATVQNEEINGKSNENTSDFFGAIAPK